MLEKNLKVVTTTLYDTYPFLYYRTILSINGYTVFIYTGGESEEDCERIAMSKYFNNKDANIISSRIDSPVKLDTESKSEIKIDKLEIETNPEPINKIETHPSNNLDICIGGKIYDIKGPLNAVGSASNKYGTNNLVTGTGHIFDPRYW